MSARSIHPFPARMAPDIALEAIPERANTCLTILDPMCGSGTVLAAALQRGHDAIGVDIDPLAVMMSSLAVTAIDTTALAVRAEKVVRSARKASGTAPWGDDSETNEFVNYWFAPEQKAQLVALATAVNSVRDSTLKLALQLAISRIIVTKSPHASLAADTSHSRPHRVRTISDYDAISGFEQSVTQLCTMLERRTLRGSGRVKLGDARDLAGIADASVDMVVTSPPYLNALDYLRGHKFALVWFGHSIADLRALRSGSIGAERRLGHSTSEIVAEIVDVIESEATDKTLLRRPMLERFAHDCVGFASQLHAKLKPGCNAVLVVGNSTLRGNYIRNDFITLRAMEHAGFRFTASIEREIPPNRRYMAISARSDASSITKRMRSEVVLTMES